MRLGDPFVSASHDLQEHYAVAKAGQWRADDLDWDGVAIAFEQGVAADRARAGRAVFTGGMIQMAEIMVATAGRMAAGWEHMDAQLVLAVEAHDYARHMEVWRRYLERLGVPADIVPELQRAFARLRDAPVPTAALTMLVLVYQLGLGRVYGLLSAEDVCPLRRLLCARLRDDVRRHIEAGRALLGTLPAKERSAAVKDIDREAETWWSALGYSLGANGSGGCLTLERLRVLADECQAEHERIMESIRAV